MEASNGQEVSSHNAEKFLSNANKLLSQIPIKLEDKTYTLEYTMYSLIRLDEDCNINLFSPSTLRQLFPDVAEKAAEAAKGQASPEEITMALLNSLRPRLVAQLVWAGLLNNPELAKLTVEEVASKFNLMSLIDQLSAFAGVQKAVISAMPAEDEQKKSS